VSIPSQVPDAGTPIFDERGFINPVWHSFFFSLLRRTGGTVGVDPIEQENRIESLERRAGETEIYEYSQAPNVKPAEEVETGFAWNHGAQYDPLHHAIATINDNGFMSSADKAKLDGVTPGAAVASVSGVAPIVSSGGTTPAISITPATNLVAGSMSAADKLRVDQLAASQSPTFVAVSLTNGQVVFPATQVPSANVNTLDDYAEGSWTPTLTCTTPGDLNVVYAVRAAVYTKIGRLVSASFVIQTSTFTRTTAAGGLLISGLPVAMSGITTVAGKLDWSGVTKATFTELCLLLPSGATTLQVIANGSGVARASVLITDLPSGGTVYLSGTIQYTSA
jgi:hypothetical protein